MRLCVADKDQRAGVDVEYPVSKLDAMVLHVAIKEFLEMARHIHQSSK